MSHELYKKHRPKTFDNVVGQDGVIASLETKIEKGKVPHAIMLVGPSGCGKTTIARILRRALKCSKHSYKELNAAEDRGIDMVRTIKRSMHQAPRGGKCNVYCIDEAHMMTKEAKNAILKPLEDTPDHVYFILCTTDPQKIIPTIKTRCTQYKLKALSANDIKKTVGRIIKKEKIKALPLEVMIKLIDAADGSARKAVVILDAIQDMKKTDKMVAAIGDAMSETAAFGLGKLLMNPKVQWKTVGKMLQDLDAEDPEALRYMILGYARSALIKGWGNKVQAYNIIDAFREHFYDSKKAGLCAACYEVVFPLK